MHPLAEQLLKTIHRHRFICAGDRVAAAVSGGADSVALLHLLLELRSEIGFILSVAHVNHKLRGADSDEDQRFVADLAQRHSLEFHLCEPSTAPNSGYETSTDPEVRSNIEGTARLLRYTFFRRLSRDQRISKIATAHTLDDQAETVLLRIFRGAGIRGLVGIHPRMVLRWSASEQNLFAILLCKSNAPALASGEIIRPLLNFRRADLQTYLREHNQHWREDASNLDVSFLRNRIRHRLLPAILADFGDGVIEHLAELAEIARAEDEHWSAHPEVQFSDPHEIQSSAQRSHSSTASPQPVAQNSRPPLALQSLLSLPLAAQRRLIRSWIETADSLTPISFRMIDNVLELANELSGKKLELSPSITVYRTADALRIESNPVRRAQSSTENNDRAPSYEYTLPIPGTVSIPELGIRLEARFVDVATVSDLFSDSLLDPALLPSHLLIRNWRAGDRYWPAHTKQEKKVKELLTARHAIGLEKKLWPVAVAESSIFSEASTSAEISAPTAASNQIVWMRGFAVPAKFLPPPDSTCAVCIRELP